MIYFPSVANQLTLRGFSKEIEREIHQTAAEKNISLNKAALLLLQRGAGLSENRAQAVAASLGKYIGSWSQAEEARLKKSIRELDQIDSEFWK